MLPIPFYISALMGLTTLYCLYILFKSGFSKRILIGLTLWIAVISLITLRGFFLQTHSLPPRFLLVILPPVLLILTLFLTSKGKQFLSTIKVKTLVLIHAVRIPIEIMLYLLAGEKLLPELMTFEGRNFDILAGISSLLIYWFGYHKNTLSRNFLLGWNLVSLSLLFNIVINAILSTPSSFQQFAFDVPNQAILYFPFVLLPGLVVPAVLFSHLASLRSLVLKQSSISEFKVAPSI